MVKHVTKLAARVAMARVEKLVDVIPARTVLPSMLDELIGRVAGRDRIGVAVGAAYAKRAGPARKFRSHTWAAFNTGLDCVLDAHDLALLSSSGNGLNAAWVLVPGIIDKLAHRMSGQPIIR